MAATLLARSKPSIVAHNLLHDDRLYSSRLRKIPGYGEDAGFRARVEDWAEKIDSIARQGPLGTDHLIEILKRARISENVLAASSALRIRIRSTEGLQRARIVQAMHERGRLFQELGLTGDVKKQNEFLIGELRTTRGPEALKLVTDTIREHIRGIERTSMDTSESLQRSIALRVLILDGINKAVGDSKLPSENRIAAMTLLLDVLPEIEAEHGEEMEAAVGAKPVRPPITESEYMSVFDNALRLCGSIPGNREAQSLVVSAVSRAPPVVHRRMIPLIWSAVMRVLQESEELSRQKKPLPPAFAQAREYLRLVTAQTKQFDAVNTKVLLGMFLTSESAGLRKALLPALRRQLGLVRSPKQERERAAFAAKYMEPLKGMVLNAEVDPVASTEALNLITQLCIQRVQPDGGGTPRLALTGMSERQFSYFLQEISEKRANDPYMREGLAFMLTSMPSQFLSENSEKFANFALASLSAGNATVTQRRISAAILGEMGRSKKLPADVTRSQVFSSLFDALHSSTEHEEIKQFMLALNQYRRGLTGDELNELLANLATMRERRGISPQSRDVINHAMVNLVRTFGALTKPLYRWKLRMHGDALAAAFTDSLKSENPGTQADAIESWRTFEGLWHGKERREIEKSVLGKVLKAPPKASSAAAVKIPSTLEGKGVSLAAFRAVREANANALVEAVRKREGMTTMRLMQYMTVCRERGLQPDPMVLSELRKRGVKA
ncbi:hypothetical protein COU36_02070 [Candidatus Micrarchaeota archaeon CG10_big_fil_rev_8_21_14_0_10_59_7]|nr:MAG: hypothetical protein COU36_02070 [Candidatus Micrarchaeota archaeon CG10_big_fil_rev_8_21_14_0_10_59_7]